MTPVTRVEGRAIPFGAKNVDTDIIIPAEHLKTIARSGLGVHAFETLRQNTGNLFDLPENRSAPILIAGDNFGCGSSREHAVWALMDLGVRAVIAPSFSDIFAGNAFKNGLVTVVVSQDAIDRLMTVATETTVTIDLETMTVTTPFQDRIAFDMDPFRRQCLLAGQDEIALTLASRNAIARYEASAPQLAWAIGAAIQGSAI